MQIVIFHTYNSNHVTARSANAHTVPLRSMYENSPEIDEVRPEWISTVIAACGTYVQGRLREYVWIYEQHT